MCRVLLPRSRCARSESERERCQCGWSIGDGRSYRLCDGLDPKGHNRGGLRFGSGDTAWVNQQYAYDIDLRINGNSCDDNCDELKDWFCYTKAIRAVANGEVVLLIQGKPENPEPLCDVPNREDYSACTSYDGGANMDQAVPPGCQFTAGAGGCNGFPTAGLCSNLWPAGVFRDCRRPAAGISPWHPPIG